MQTVNLPHQYDLWSLAIEDIIKKVKKIIKKGHKERYERINKNTERIKERILGSHKLSRQKKNNRKKKNN